MQPKYWKTLEYDKIVNRLAGYTSFSAGRELAESLEPSTDLDLVRQRQKETSEAKALLDMRPDVTVGSARDVRPLVYSAEVGATLDPSDLLTVRNTLQSAGRLRRILSRFSDRFPLLADTADRLEECPHLVEEISRCLNDQGDVVDAASPALGRIRREMAITHDRLLDRLNKMVGSSEYAHLLQESLVTMRSGRYVIPLKAEFRGRIPGIVHDQSGSGATLFIEPLATVEMNNRWRELQLQEEEEVNRILRELTAQVADDGQAITLTVENLAVLDLAFAKAQYSYGLRAAEPALIDLEKSARPDQRAAELPPGVVIHLRKARHPLLDPETVVPIDVTLGGDYNVLLVTGPNTGGKTVSLKTVGLLTLMAQAGLHIPAREDSAVAVFEGVYADIGDEQSIEQSLSTFSSHMGNIIEILKGANERSLVLLDELGAGTDPVEGAALARSLLTNLLERDVYVMGTTHYSELKVFAHNTPRVENASVEFDVETLTPTYRLITGLPGRSQAFAIAARLGLDPSILEGAKRWISEEELQTEQMLADIKLAREEALADRETAKTVLRNAQRWERDLQRKSQAIEAAREEILNEAREEARCELEAVRKQMAEFSARLSRPGSPADALTKDWLAAAQSELKETARQMRPLSAPSPQDEGASTELEVGDQVFVPSLQQQGTLVLLDGSAAEVGIGRFRVRVRVEELRKAESALAEPEERRGIRVIDSARPRPGVEIEIRGMRVEDALPRLEKYLDDAYLAGLPWVRIIHGKGTGTLRRVVREHLTEHPLVASVRAGEHGEGDEGVTVATLVKSA